MVSAASSISLSAALSTPCRFAYRELGPYACLSLPLNVPRCYQGPWAIVRGPWPPSAARDQAFSATPSTDVGAQPASLDCRRSPCCTRPPINSREMRALPATGKPEGIAELVAFLVSPGARWMTGSTLRRDRAKSRSQRKCQVIPTDNKLGFPPAALNRSYSARTAQEPNLYCAPPPPAPLVFVRFS